MNNRLIDIIERFQWRHALQEEREMKNFHASMNGAVAPGVPDKNGIPKKSIFETEEARASAVTVPGQHGMVAATQWPDRGWSSLSQLTE